MKFTDTQRNELIDALSHGLSRAKMFIEGHEVIFEARLQKPLVYCLQPYVDGILRGAWLARSAEDLDEAGQLWRRLMRHRVSKIYGPTEFKKLNRLNRELGREPITKERNEITSLDTWHCPRALVRHLEREFEHIEIVEPHHAAA